MASNDLLAWAVAEAYCGWDPSIVVTNTQAILDGNGSRTIALPSLYVTDVASVIVATDREGGTYDASAEVKWKPNGIVTLTSNTLSAFPEGAGTVTITWSGGYSSIPQDLQAAVDSITARVASMGMTQARIGTASMSYAPQVAAGGLLLVEQMILDKYRLPRVA